MYRDELLFCKNFLAEFGFVLISCDSICKFIINYSKNCTYCRSGFFQLEGVPFGEVRAVGSLPPLVCGVSCLLVLEMRPKPSDCGFTSDVFQRSFLLYADGRGTREPRLPNKYWRRIC